MDALKGRFQTTEGIWMAGCVGMEPCTLVMDMEGTDGRERGEDDTAFEKQSALFALAVSDIMLINMWCHDIGREQAANRPLLKTVFQRSASSKKQPTVVRSSTEAEYRALATVAAEITWLQMLLKDLHIALKVAPVAFCDNISATYLAYNPVLHSKSKHIAIDYHFVREKVLLGDLKVQHVPTQLQLADIFTKALPSSKFKSALSNLCLPNQTQLEGDVMVQLFSPRKTTLIFVIRDKTKTPLEHLEPVLRDDIQKIWDAVLKPEAHKETPFTDFFNVEVVALSSYEENEAQFKEQVADLRQRFHHSIAPGGLAGDRRAVVPALGFAFSAQHIWNIIKENKDLDLPAHKVMVATVRCGEIAEDKLNSFVVNKEWLDLEETVKLTLVPGFGQKLSSLLGTCLSEYDAEATYFDEGVRASKRTGLENNLLQHVQLAYQSMLGHLRSETLEKLKQSLTDALSKGKGFALAAHECTDYSMLQFNKGCLDATITQANWDISKMRDKLHRDIDAHIEAVRSAKLSELISLCEEKLNAALSAPVEALLDDAGDGTWPAIRKLLRRETEDAISGFSASLSGYELDESTNGKMISGLKDYARGVVEGKARKEARSVLILMKDRFSRLFAHDSDSLPRVWTGKEDIKAITKTARSSSLKLLSVMAAIRLDEDADNVEKTLSLALIESGAAKSTTSADLLASSTWDEVPPEKTLISPVECKSLWRQFLTGTEYNVRQAQAISAEAARKRGNYWLPPPWAIFAVGALILYKLR